MSSSISTSSISNQEFSYKRVLDRLYQHQDFEKRRATSYTKEHYNLNNIKKILTLLGNPQNSFRSFHVAGTKGKGSCTHFLAYCLEELGYRTGYTVSPQLIDERDRFYLRGKRSTWEEIIPIFVDVLKVIEKAGMRPTVFDIFTAVAFKYFQKGGVEIAIIETGLGGRWDSTNCLAPNNLIGCLITLIDYDHTDKLGGTLPLIAEEKAGIIKSKIPVFTFNPENSVCEVLRRKAEKEKSQIYFIKKIHPFIQQITSKEFSEYLPESIKINLNLVVSSLDLLGYPITVNQVKNVIKKLPLPGRYHKFRNMIIDGAHTAYSLKNFVGAIKSDPSFCHYRKVKVYFYCLYDKDVTSLIKQIPKQWDLFFFDCQVQYVDSQKINQVKKIINTTRGQEVKTVYGFNSLDWENNPGHLYVFTGSFKLVGYVLQYLSTIENDVL